jgi:hypothetical protein
LQGSWIKYSGLAIQFVFFILCGYWLGGWVAPYLGWEHSSGELAGILFFLTTGLIKIVRDVLRETE